MLVWCPNRLAQEENPPAGISKRGDTYLRALFIHGARAAALLTKEPGPWITN